MEYLYTFTASALLSKFFFSIFPSAVGPSGSQIGIVVSGFVMIGFFVIFVIQKCARVCHSNPYYTSPEVNFKEIRSIIDPENMQIQEYIMINAEGDATERLEVKDEFAELKKRRINAYLALSVLSIIVIFEGFFIVYRSERWTWALVIMFYVDKLMETGIVCTCMLHAFFHSSPKRFWNRYWLFGIFWTIVIILSTTPILAQMPWESSYIMLNHVATCIFYALAGGLLFWVSFYFILIDRKRIDRSETVVLAVIFGVTAVVGWIVGFFT